MFINVYEANEEYENIYNNTINQIKNKKDNFVIPEIFINI